MKKIAISGTKALECFYPHEIIYLKGDGDVTHFIIATGENSYRVICSSKHLKHYERLLPHDVFVRTSKNYIINFNFLEGIEGDTLLLKKPAPETATLSDTYRDNVENRLVK
jgi:DNA-binding LytR/AlgR family response regulator